MIGNLIKEAPHIWKLIRNELIGNDGTPGDGGRALGGYVREAEKKHNAEPGTYWYRFFRPDDSLVGGTAKTYYATFTTVTEENVLATGSVMTVPTGEAAAIFGIICLLDLGEDGYIQIKKETVTKVSIPALIPYRQQNPTGYYIDLDTVIVGEENAKLDFVTYNGHGADRAGIVIPLMFRIATRSALNLERPYR